MDEVIQRAAIHDIEAHARSPKLRRQMSPSSIARDHPLLARIIAIRSQMNKVVELAPIEDIKRHFSAFPLSVQLPIILGMPSRYYSEGADHDGESSQDVFHGFAPDILPKT